jgi:hypothetical protein
MSGLTNIIPSYLYQEYADDDNLQAFVMSQNALAQTYLDWFNSINLPVYTGPQIVGPLLDWVAAGIYGETRPTLPSGNTTNDGALNTLALNELALNGWFVVEPTTFYNTSDDIFKRILTWNFYKGDGKNFNIRWLKRRIMRFLLGTNGTDLGTQSTYQISINFTGNQVDIEILYGKTFFESGAALNISPLNVFALNIGVSSIIYYPQFEYANILISAINAGMLNMPFQFTYNISIVT